MTIALASTKNAGAHSPTKIAGALAVARIVVLGAGPDRDARQEDRGEPEAVEEVAGQAEAAESLS